MDIVGINTSMNKLREEKVNTCLVAVSEWNSENDEIQSLILTLEELYSCVTKLNNRVLERKCDDAVINIKSSSIYAKQVNEVKKQLKKQGFGQLCYVICDKNGLCISSLIDGHVKDLDTDDSPVIIDHIDNRKEWNYWE